MQVALLRAEDKGLPWYKDAPYSAFDLKAIIKKEER